MGDIVEITHFFQTIMIFWFFLFMGVVAFKLSMGSSQASDFLKTVEGGPDAPERFVALIMSIGVAAAYVVLAINHEVPDMRDATNIENGLTASLPDIPDGLLATLAGAKSIYLSGKIARKGDLHENS